MLIQKIIQNSSMHSVGKKQKYFILEHVVRANTNVPWGCNIKFTIHSLASCLHHLDYFLIT